MLATGLTIGKEITAALGLAGRSVYALKLEVAADDLLRLTTYEYVTIEQSNELLKVLKQYNLEAHEDESEVLEVHKTNA